MKELKNDSKKNYPLYFFLGRVVLFCSLFLYSISLSQIYVSSDDVLFVDKDAVVSNGPVKISKNIAIEEKSSVGKIYIIGAAEIKDENQQIFAEKVHVSRKEGIKSKPSIQKIADKFSEGIIPKISKSFKKSKPKFIPRIEGEKSSSVSFVFGSNYVYAISISNYYNQQSILSSLDYSFHKIDFTESAENLQYQNNLFFTRLLESYSIRPPPFSV